MVVRRASAGAVGDEGSPLKPSFSQHAAITDPGREPRAVRSIFKSQRREANTRNLRASPCLVSHPATFRCQFHLQISAACEAKQGSSRRAGFKQKGTSWRGLRGGGVGKKLLRCRHSQGPHPQLLR